MRAAEMMAALVYLGRATFRANDNAFAVRVPRLTPLARWVAKHGAGSVRRVPYELPGGAMTMVDGGRTVLIYDASQRRADLQNAAADFLRQQSEARS